MILTSLYLVVVFPPFVLLPLLRRCFFRSLISSLPFLSFLVMSSREAGTFEKKRKHEREGARKRSLAWRCCSDLHKLGRGALAMRAPGMLFSFLPSLRRGCFPRFARFSFFFSLIRFAPFVGWRFLTTSGTVPLRGDRCVGRASRD